MKYVFEVPVVDEFEQILEVVYVCAMSKEGAEAYVRALDLGTVGEAELAPDSVSHPDSPYHIHNVVCADVPSYGISPEERQRARQISFD